jgi:hypothetical protein
MIKRREAIESFPFSFDKTALLAYFCNETGIATL